MTRVKDVLFIGRRETRSDYDTSTSMAQAMEGISQDIRYSACDLEDLVFAFDGDNLQIIDMKSNQDIAQFEAIFLLGWFKTKLLEDAALSVAIYAEAHGTPVLNSEVRFTRSRTKLSQYVLAATHGVSSAPFVFSMDNSLSLQYMQNHWTDYPVIAKSTIASRGKDNYLVQTQDELRKLIEEQPDVPFVMQGFIPNDGDYRLIVMGDRVRLVMLRQSQSESHLNNTSQGGAAMLVDAKEVDQGMLADSVKIAQLVRREVTGVDMIVHRDTGKFYLLEVNNMPQFSTGRQVPDKMRMLNEYFEGWLSGND